MKEEDEEREEDGESHHDDDGERDQWEEGETEFEEEIIKEDVFYTVTVTLHNLQFHIEENKTFPRRHVLGACFSTLHVLTSMFLVLR